MCILGSQLTPLQPAHAGEYEKNTVHVQYKCLMENEFCRKWTNSTTTYRENGVSHVLSENFT